MRCWNGAGGPFDRARRPAARATYDGIFKAAGQLDCEISAQVFGSTGVIIDAAARQGTLSGALDGVPAGSCRSRPQPRLRPTEIGLMSPRT